MNMNRDEFEKALCKEGLLVYGTPYEENFKKLKELQNYKKIVEEIDERLMPGKVNAVECPDHTNMGELSTLEFVRLVIKEIKKKYFPEPHEINWKDRFDELEEEFEESERELKTEIEHWRYLYHNKQY